MARPRTKFSEEQTNGEGIDIVLCFDISGSMNEKDFTPTRLEVSKQLATDFVNGRPGDKIGVTIFSKISFTLCPLTTDHATVVHQIRNIHSGYLLEEGTSVGSGIATSVDRLRADTAKTKVIILLTDGVDFGGEVQPDVAIEMAKRYGVKIYTIGIGSNKVVEEQVESQMGTYTQKKKLEYNENLLQLLAKETGGKYYQAQNRDAMQQIYENINLLEKSKIQTTQYTYYTDHYYGLVILAVLLLVIELLLRYTVFRRFP
jgi:Ca-activated chloride channel family protein